MSLATQAQQLKQDFDAVYEAGKTKEWSDFWDVFQINGSRYNYERAFFDSYRNVWKDDIFKPKYDITVTYANQMFYGTPITDLVEILKKQRVTINFKNTKGLTQTFENCTTKKLPEINIPVCTSIARMCCNCTKLETIEKIIISENTTVGGTNAFTSCSKLANIVFEGVIVFSLNFSWCPLTVASMKSIISCLKDYSAESPFTYTLTLSDDCKADLETDTETVEFNGQNYTYFELITAKGWNLA